MSRILVTGIGPFGSEEICRYSRLAGPHDITLLASVPAGWPDEIVEHGPGLREYRVARGESYARHYVGLGDSATDKHRIALARSVVGDEPLRRTFFRLSEACNAIVHTSSVLFAIDDRCGADGKPRLYDALAGLEYVLTCHGTPDSPFGHDAFEIHTLESRLVTASARVIVPNEASRDEFRLWYGCPAEKLSGELPSDIAQASSFERPPRRRHIVLVNDYRIDIPGGGGHVRLLELYRHAARQCFSFTLICLSDAPQRRDTVLSPHFRQIAVPKTTSHTELETRIDSMHDASAADIVALVCCANNRELQREFQMAAMTADAVVFEHVYMAPLLRHVPAGVPAIYSAQNVESLLKEKTLASHPCSTDLMEAVQAAEAELVSRTDAVICLAREDAAEFEGRTRGPLHVIENGVIISDHADTGDRKGALFIGSAHPPNVEALEFIVSRLARELPDVPFYILGAVCAAAHEWSVPPNVSLLGRVSDARKKQLLGAAAAGLNPMFSGSGSNLKLPEYFGARLPVVSTAFGTRGFAVQDGVHLCVAEADGFAEAVRALLADREGSNRIASAAYEYAANCISWPVLGKKLCDILEPMLPLTEAVWTLHEESGSVVVQSGTSEIRFAVPEAFRETAGQFEPNARNGDSLVQFVQKRSFADEDPALRSCTPACPELDRFVSLYAEFAKQASVRGGPRGSARRAARLLEMSAVPVTVEPVFDAADIQDHWLGWYDTLKAAAAVCDEDPSHSAVLDELQIRRQC